MAEVETYIASGGREAAIAAGAGPTPGTYNIAVRFLGGLTDRQKSAFKGAANRWTRAISGDLPSVTVDGEVVDDLLILAQGAPIDGPGRVLGQAGPTHLRPAGAGTAAFLPAKGTMTFDTADLAQMEANGTLDDVITHEMGHVIGIGTIWTRKNVVKGIGTANPVFLGQNAMRAYAELRASPNPLPVPVENTGGPGTAGGHWRETVFGTELMTGFVNQAGNPLSLMTIESLLDLGYDIDRSAADHYALPGHLELAEAGVLTDHSEESRGIVITNIPQLLPEGSLV
ncbi:leishmanolysin-related zinc metalloendopeptidase [Methylobacterium planeticum]|uniref:Peptidase n=1 Tax=Methylobacterium planeticum TaxID=2615211 RepID=A0A6N6MGL8_9HYPH|nr:leishmanolysin-related zinc metalloendopeptidase [Methylobacterium planeticum]KAB1068574.1 peptidase [Methylobacterium planeticum]